MKITLQMPEILVASGCGCLISGSPLLSSGMTILISFSLIFSGLLLRFIYWSLELTSDSEET